MSTPVIAINHQYTSFKRTSSDVSSCEEDDELHNSQRRFKRQNTGDNLSEKLSKIADFLPNHLGGNPSTSTSTFYILEDSGSDTESVHSFQGKETEIAKDTSDTSSSLDSDTCEEDMFTVEYDPVSATDKGEEDGDSSSGTDSEMEQVTAAAVIGIIEEYITDGEDNGNTSDEIEIDLEISERRRIMENKTGYGKCIQCKSQCQNPLFRFCEKCFQIKKTRYPPRPRGHRPRNKTNSTDSGISSQESFPSSLNDVPNNEPLSIKSNVEEHQLELQEKTDVITRIEAEAKLTNNDSCIMCANNPKNGIFVHGTKGHICSCYTCAVKIYKKTKRCPVCNCKIRNVIKAFTL